MAVMRMVGAGRRPPAHVHVDETEREYVIELDVSDFTEDELTVDVLGRQLTVRGDQLAPPPENGAVFGFRERLEESFRLPDDADVDAIRVFCKHGKLELRVPRARQESRRLPIEHPDYLVNPDAEAC
jgi:HSP20 family molecular chaperone IbpA